jgi:hypothetical protein
MDRQIVKTRRKPGVLQGSIVKKIVSVLPQIVRAL